MVSRPLFASLGVQPLYTSGPRELDLVKEKLPTTTRAATKAWTTTQKFILSSKGFLGARSSFGWAEYQQRSLSMGLAYGG